MILTTFLCWTEMDYQNQRRPLIILNDKHEDNDDHAENDYQEFNNVNTLSVKKSSHSLGRGRKAIKL